VDIEEMKEGIKERRSAQEVLELDASHLSKCCIKIWRSWNIDAVEV
jgi:hypothetical protein